MVFFLLFHFLGSMKFLGEYRECRFAGVQEKRDVVQRAIHFMQENLNKKIRLTDIAREVKLSPSYFSNVFEDKTGSPPLRYLGSSAFRKPVIIWISQS